MFSPIHHFLYTIISIQLHIIYYILNAHYPSKDVPEPICLLVVIVHNKATNLEFGSFRIRKC